MFERTIKDGTGCLDRPHRAGDRGDRRGRFLGLRFTRPVGLTDVAVVLERSTDLDGWDSGPGFTVQEGAPVDNLDGTETVVLRSETPIGDVVREFVRLRAWRLSP